MQNQNPLTKSLTECKKIFWVNFFFSFGINILMLTTSLYSLQVLDRVLSSFSIETLIMLSLIILVVYIAISFLQTIRSFIFLKISQWLDLQISQNVLNNSISYHSNYKGSQSLRDLQQVKSFVTGQAITHLFDAPFSILYI